MGVMDYVNSRLKGITEAGTTFMNEVNSQGPVKATVDVLTSGFGALDVNDFGEKVSANRAAARKQLMGNLGSMLRR